MDTILIAGYPRSGNVWIARLLGDALDRPIDGGSLAAEGQDRPGLGRVMQAHFWPGTERKPLQINGQLRQDKRPILVVRDPRDVLVSAAAYWDWTLEQAFGYMVEGPGPLNLPSWRTYVEAWLQERVPIVRYEDFHQDALGELNRLLEKLGDEPRKPLEEVVERQSFAVKRAEMDNKGDDYPFGRTAQLRHLRRGSTGEWRTALPSSLARKATTAWLSLLSRLGYHHERGLSCSEPEI